MTTTARTTTRTPLTASLAALAAGLIWAMGAVTVKLAKHTDAWQYLIYRSIGVLVVMEIISRRRGQRWMTPRAFNQGKVMILGTLGLLLASVAYIYALKTTTAANAAFLASITPILAAVLARLFLGERLTTATVAAIGLSMTGLVVIVAADISGGNMTGNIAALFSSLGFASYTVCVRSEPNRDWSPILPGYALLMIVMCAAVTLLNGSTLAPPVADIGEALLHGGVFIVVGTLLYNFGSRRVPAVPMTVYAQTETVFVPIFTLVWFGISPKPLTLLGGAIIISAVIGKATIDARGAPEPAIIHDAAVEPGPGSIA